MTWLNCTDSPHSWIVLIEALESRPVGEKLLDFWMSRQNCIVLFLVGKIGVGKMSVGEMALS